MKALVLFVLVAAAFVAVTRAETATEMVEYCPNSDVAGDDLDDESDAQDKGYPLDGFFSLFYIPVALKRKDKVIRVVNQANDEVMCISCDASSSMKGLTDAWDHTKENLHTHTWQTNFMVFKSFDVKFASEEDKERLESGCNGASVAQEAPFSSHHTMQKYRKTAVSQRDASEADAPTSRTALDSVSKVAYLILGGKPAGSETFHYVDIFVKNLAAIKKGLEDNYDFTCNVFYPKSYAEHKMYAKIVKGSEWNALTTGGTEYTSTAGLIKALEDATKKNEEADAYFHFLGHGDPGYLYTPAGEIYYAKEGRDLFNKIYARNAVFAIDACHSAHAFSSELNDYWTGSPVPNISTFFGMSSAAPAQEAGGEVSRFLGDIYGLEKSTDKITQSTTSTQLEDMVNASGRGALGFHIWHLKDTSSLRIGQVYTNPDGSDDGNNSPVESDDTGMEPTTDTSDDSGVPVTKVEDPKIKADEEELSADTAKLKADKDEEAANTNVPLLRGNNDA